MPELDLERCGPGSRSGRALLLILVVVLGLAACGGSAASRTGRTVTFVSGGAFPPSTIVGTYSVRSCMADARTLVDDARLYYNHSTGGLGPADLYYYDLRFDYAHFQADDCTSKELGDAMKHGLTAEQRAFLLHNVASDLHHAFQSALGAA